jgi:hypothetical protein
VAHLRAEALDLVDNEAFHALNGVFVLKAEVEGLDELVSVNQNRWVGDKTHGGAHRLVGRVVPDLEVRVVQRLLAGNAFRGIKVEQLREEVDCERVCAREERRERHTGFDR